VISAGHTVSKHRELLLLTKIHSDTIPDIPRAVSSIFSLTLQHVWLPKSSPIDLS